MTRLWQDEGCGLFEIYLPSNLFGDKVKPDSQSPIAYFT